MAAIRVLKFSTAINLGGFDSGVKSMHKTGQKLGHQLKTTGNQIGEGFKGSTIGVGKALGVLGGAVAGFKAFEFIKDGVTGASDLNESLSKTDAILGDASPAVKQFADNMATDFGFAKQEILDAGSGFAGLAKGLGGLTGGGLSAEANKLTTLAADIGSFANLSFDEAASALRVTLSGEQSDTLKQLGVVIKEKTVADFLEAKGINKVNGEYTEQQKYQARSALLFEQLKDATGDLSRTSDSASNQQKKLAGSFTNLGTSIGTMLLPAYGSLLKFGNGLIGSLNASLGFVAPYVAKFTSSLLYGFDVIGQAATFVLSPLASLGQSLAASFSLGTSGITSFLPSFSSVVDAVKGGVLSIGMFVVDMVNQVSSIPTYFIAAFGPETLAGVGNFATAVGTWVSGAFDTVSFGVRNFGDLVSYAFVSASMYVGTFIDNFTKIATFISGDWFAAVMQPFAILGEVIQSLATSFWEFLKNPTGGFSLNTAAIGEEFAKFTAKAPELSAVPASSPKLDAIANRIAEREANFAKSLGDGFQLPEFKQLAPVATGTAPVPAIETPEKKDAGLATVKFAGAAKLGSTDAYKSLSVAFAGKTGGGPGDSVEKNTKESVKELRRANKTFNRVAKAVESNTLQFGVLKA